MRNILIYFALKYHGEYERILQAINEKESVSQAELDDLKKNLPNAITIIDEEYPIELKTIYAPPLVLFYKGDISLLKEKNKLAVIGSRNPSDYGLEATKKILNELFVCKDIIIVSGLAKGIDALAHQITIDNQKGTIAVLGCGIEYCYPKKNALLKEKITEKGLILSEYPCLTKPQKNYFPFRNRIISGLSKGVLVTDAQVKSGTQITVRFALEQGKDVFAIPHSIFKESACNVLIKEGAIPICNGKDLLEFFEK